MATVKPRINMALRPEHFDVVTRLAKLQGRSRSAVVVELLEQAIPVLERVVVVGEAAQRAQVSAREELRSSLEKAEAAILPHVNAAMGQLDAFLPADPSAPSSSTKAQRDLRASAERSEAPSASSPRTPRRKRPSPRLVTRGPGRGAHRGGKPSSKGRKHQ